MADNVVVTAGTGTTVAADEVVDGTLGTVKVQFVKIMDGTLDGTTKAAVGAAGLKVDASGATQPISIAAVTPIASAAAESSHVIKGSAGTLYDWHATIGAVAGYVMIFNAASAPADGAVTPIFCYAVAAFNTVFNTGQVPTTFSTGITMVFSSTGPFTKTASATAFFSAKAV